MPASATGTPVTLCGELAGKPISAMALIGLGYRSISMSPAAIGPVKAMLPNCRVGELKTFLDDALWQGRRAAATCGALLQSFAETHGVPL